jgi:cyclopropane-fatty-acyl-phospholipid synthase
MTAKMLTMPRFLGYAFNPLTTYYIYDPHLVAVVLEVHNTFHEKHIYPVPFTPSKQSITRRFHVSPFNDRLGTYTFKTRDPNLGLSIELTVMSSENEPKLYASLKSSSRSASLADPGVLWVCVACGWWIFMTFPRIVYEAGKLHYAKKMPVYVRPEPVRDEGTVVRQQATYLDTYFRRLVVEDLKWKREAVRFEMLSGNTLEPEVIEIGAPSETVTILSDAFFTNLVCGADIAGFYEGKFDKQVDLEGIAGRLDWRERVYLRYMVIKARISIWMDQEFFRRIATFAHF